MRTAMATALAVLLLAGAPARAQDLPPEARQALSAQVEVLREAVSGGDVAAALDVLPPRLLQGMADMFGLSRDQLRAAVRQAGEGLSADLETSTYAMDLDAAERRTTPDGSRVFYLVPTETVMKIAGQPAVRTRSHSLALEDDGWWLVRVSEPQQVAFLRQIYPEFVGVDFPEPSITVLD